MNSLRQPLFPKCPSRPENWRRLGSLGRAELAQFAMQGAGTQPRELRLTEIAHFTRRERVTYIFLKPQESKAEASCQMPALLSPSTTTITSRPGIVPLAIRQ